MAVHMASLVIATRKSIYNTPSKLYNAPKILQEKIIMRLNDYFKNKKRVKIVDFSALGKCT